MLLKGKTFLSFKIITSLDSTKGVTLKHLIPPSPKMQYFSNLIEMLSDLARHISSILHSIVSLSQVNVQLGKKMELSQERELTHQREQMSATLNFHVLEHTQNTQLPNHPRHQTSL